MANTPHKFKSGIAVTGTATINTDEITTNTAVQTLTNKTIDGNNNTLQNIPNSALSSGIDATKIADGSVSNTEFQFLDGVTSSIQTQIDSKASSSDLASTANGLGASLIGVEDSAGNFTGTNLEDVVAELQTNIASSQAGVNMKDAVQVATTADITLSGEQTIDGVLTSSSRILVKDQSDATQNGIYVTDAGAWTRATDFDGNPTGEVKGGNLVYVQEGTQNANTQFILQGNADDKNVGTDPLNFSIFSRAEAIVAGTGLNKTGLTLSVDMGDFTTTDLAEGTNLYFTDERAQDAVGNIFTDTSKIDFTYDDGTPQITATIVAGSLDNADISASAAIDATKIADGSVTNAEFQFIGGLTSDAQTQLDSKLNLSGGTMTGVLTLSADPTTNLEAATKQYVDTEIAAIPSGANTSLSNLSSVAVNTDFLPDTTNLHDLGSVSLRWEDLFVNDAHIEDLYVTTGTAGVATMRLNAAIGALQFLTSAGSIQTASGTSSSGIVIVTGDGSAGNSGDIRIETGTATAVRGSVILDGSQVDVNTTKIINVVDPTDAQDAATKAYVDSEIAGIAAGANTTLSNLTSPTSINQDLLPDSDLVRDLGSDTLLFNSLYVQDIKDSSDTNSVRITTRQLVAPNATTVLDWNNNLTATLHKSLFPNVDNTLALGSSANNLNTVATRIVQAGDGTNQTLTLNGSDINMSSKQVKDVADPTDNQDAATKNYVDTEISGISIGSAGDIQETSFSMANDVSTPTDVTGFAFANATVRGFVALVTVEINATADLYETFELRGIQKGSDWDMSVAATGDDSNVAFSITSAGQIQYTSGDEAGFVSGDIKFRALTTTV